MKQILLIIVLILLFTLSFSVGRILTRPKESPSQTPAPASPAVSTDLTDVPEATLSAEEATRSAGAMTREIVVTHKPENGSRITAIPKQLEIHFSAPVMFKGIGVTGNSRGLRLPEPPKVSVAGLFVIIPFPQDAPRGTYAVNYHFCSVEKDGGERKNDCRDASFSFDLL